MLMKSPCWEKAHEKLRRLRRLIFQRGHGRPQSLKSLSRCAIVLYFYSPHLPGSCNTQHTSPLRGPDKRGLSGRVFHLWGPVPGFRHAGLLPAEESTSVHQSPSFLRVSSLSTNRLADGFSAKFYLPCVQRSISVGDWRALKNTFSLLFLCNCFPGESFNRTVLPNKTPVF